MNLIKPHILSSGDTIAIITPSGPVEYDQIILAKTYFENKGYKIKLGKNLFNTNKYLAGTDEERVEDLHNAFLDDEVNAIVCARGGYGAIRLIKMLDFEVIRRHPKIFCGYSDITALSAMFLKHADLITYAAPMAQSDFNTQTPDKITEQSFFNVLKGGKEEYLGCPITDGEASGILFGGNLSTIVSLCGIDFLPDEDFIFFVEDVCEPVYKLDKMFNQLINMKEFRKHIKGIAFGEFLGVDDEKWLKELLNETANILEVPSACGFKFTHAETKQTIPYGVKATLKWDGELVVY